MGADPCLVLLSCRLRCFIRLPRAITKDACSNRSSHRAAQHTLPSEIVLSCYQLQLCLSLHMHISLLCLQTSAPPEPRDKCAHRIVHDLSRASMLHMYLKKTWKRWSSLHLECSSCDSTNVCDTDSMVEGTLSKNRMHVVLQLSRIGFRVTRAQLFGTSAGTMKVTNNHRHPSQVLDNLSNASHATISSDSNTIKPMTTSSEARQLPSFDCV